MGTSSTPASARVRSISTQKRSAFRAPGAASPCGFRAVTAAGEATSNPGSGSSRSNSGSSTHRRRDGVEVGLADLYQAEAEHIAPVALAARQLEPVEQGSDRRVVRRAIVHVAAERAEIAHVGLISTV